MTWSLRDKKSTSVLLLSYILNTLNYLGENIKNMDENTSLDKNIRYIDK